MTVTDIKLTKAGRISVFIDGEFVFSSDEETLSGYGIKKGSNIDAQTLCQLAGDTIAAKMKDKALDLLSYRDHSKRQLVDKLAKSGDRQTAQQVVNRMEEAGLVDDERFAREYASEVHTYKKWGPRRIRFELIGRGIPAPLAEEIVEELAIDENEEIREIVMQKYIPPFDQKSKKKAFDYLYRIGYSAGEIAGALRELNNECADGEDYVD